MKLEKTFAMNGGKGEHSYLHNSKSQRRHARSMVHLLREALDGMRLSSPEMPFAVADLGCSCGSNTLFTVDVIINHVAKRYVESGCEPPEFTAFFSDLPSNDFNTLFQLLPPPCEGGGCLDADGHVRPYFAAGVPGSFYRRLFATKSVDFFYSGFSLHWLSQIPEVVLDKRSTAYNKGKIFIHGSKEATANAYTKQFQSDFGGFLRSRCKELKSGGSMFLVLLGRASLDPTHQGGAGLLFGTHFEDAWDDLVQEGLITSEQRDDFNLPLYAPSVDEFKEVVEADGSFVINKVELFKGGSPLTVSNPGGGNYEIGRAFASSCRSVCSVLVDEHIGHELGNEIFSRVASRGMNHGKELLDELQLYYIVASLSLKQYSL